jgi:two-component system sensor histidine kinase VanS
VTSGDIASTLGSETLLLQLITNLVHNAIVHNLPEDGIVWVTTDVQPNGVMLTVENTGDELSPELVSTMVEPFQRGRQRIRTNQAGVGLGLAIVRSITQAHDGTITLTPRTAGGSASQCNCPPHRVGASPQAVHQRHRPQTRRRISVVRLWSWATRS